MAEISLKQIREIHQAGDIDRAGKLLELLLQKDEKNIEALDYLAFIYLQQNRFKKAKETLQKAIQFEPDNAVLYNHLGNLYRLEKDFQSAENGYQKAIELKPNYAEAHNNYGLLHHALNRYAQAECCFIQALQHRSDYIEAMYNLALSLKAQQKIDECIASLMAILKAEPKQPQAHFLLGQLLVEKKMYADSDKHFQFLLENYSKVIPIIENIVLYLLKHDRYIQAKPYCEQLIKLRPDDGETLYNLGVIHQYLNESAEAIKYYQASLNIDAHYFPALNNLAVIYLKQRDYKTARFYLELALKEQPNDISLHYLIASLSGEQVFDSAPAEYVRDLFDHYAAHYDAHLCQELNYQVPGFLKKQITKLISIDDKSLSILDLGCGTGLCAEYFKPWAKQLVGVDLSSKSIAIAKEKKLYDELIISENNIYLSQQAEKFHLIIAADVLTYYGELSQLFVAVYRALKKEGLFTFSTEISLNPDFILQPTGRFSHAKDYILRLAKKVNFDVKIVEKSVLREQENEQVLGHFFVLQK